MRMAPDERYKQLLETALQVAEDGGFMALTHSKVAASAGVVKGTVFHHFNTIDALRDAVMVEAVERNIGPVIAAGISMGNQVAQDAPENVRREALLSSL